MDILNPLTIYHHDFAIFPVLLQPPTSIHQWAIPASIYSGGSFSVFNVWIDWECLVMILEIPSSTISIINSMSASRVTHICAVTSDNGLSTSKMLSDVFFKADFKMCVQEFDSIETDLNYYLRLNLHYCSWQNLDVGFSRLVLKRVGSMPSLWNFAFVYFVLIMSSKMNTTSFSHVTCIMTLTHWTLMIKWYIWCHAMRLKKLLNLYSVPWKWDVVFCIKRIKHSAVIICPYSLTLHVFSCIFMHIDLCKLVHVIMCMYSYSVRLSVDINI